MTFNISQWSLVDLEDIFLHKTDFLCISELLCPTIITIIIIIILCDLRH